MDEKTHDADLTEKGRAFLQPEDPEDSCCRTCRRRVFHEIDSGEADPKKRIEAKAKVQTEFEAKAVQIHTISQLLKAYSLYQLDVHYVIEWQLVIVDEHTGRPMCGQRWKRRLAPSRGSRGVEVERETQTLATITIQNYFRLYKKLMGMTSTAETEAGEFLDIYKLGVMVIPTNRW